MPPGLDPGTRRALERLRAFARLLDSSVRVPGTRFRLGLDPLVGLVPVVGDWVMAGVSGWLVWRAWRMGVRGSTLVAMVLNVLLEAVVGTVPVAGDLFDAVWRANLRNMELLERDLARRARSAAVVRGDAGQVGPGYGGGDAGGDAGAQRWTAGR